MDVTEGIVVSLITAMVVGVPLFGLTLRFSLKPLVEAFIRLKEAQHGGMDVRMLRERVAHLEHVLEAHGLIDAPQPRALRSGTPEHLSAVSPLKDRERV
ncbi:hypothetical protein [Corallococcus macrosporus]|uniref:Uncharacterized protein n=2 Tax=Myxococcaceae TaxID=31 RepID=A0A250K4M8_9BACT|nr:hypothetical protein [Corallococcus macrosporus]AEI64528.1 hypothetical protein LILAB_13105 [Corallococcus macrosporus]ATB50707.1 hypothetical protein MYMAC_006363 [Corallococcus macrosporus DSM 14697]